MCFLTHKCLNVFTVHPTILAPVWRLLHVFYEKTEKINCIFLQSNLLANHADNKQVTEVKCRASTKSLEKMNRLLLGPWFTVELVRRIIFKITLTRDIWYACFTTEFFSKNMSTPVHALSRHRKRYQVIIFFADPIWNDHLIMTWVTTKCLNDDKFILKASQVNWNVAITPSVCHRSTASGLKIESFEITHTLRRFKCRQIGCMCTGEDLEGVFEVYRMLRMRKQ